MSPPTKGQIALVATGVLGWLLTIWLSGLGVSLFGLEWDFTNTGAFGDSFGPLSAIMASIAALSAIAAYKSQQNELTLQRERQVEDDRRVRRSELEGTFFRLVEAFRSIVADTDVQKGGGQAKEGRDAFRAIVMKFESDVSRTTSHHNAWKLTSSYYRNDLNHYFRFLYHIIRFVDQAEGVDSYFYIRLLRALLSESELILIALNCAYGEGAEKFKPLLEKYSLLHNLSLKAREKWQLEARFLPSAFDRPPQTGLTGNAR